MVGNNRGDKFLRPKYGIIITKIRLWESFSDLFLLGAPAYIKEKTLEAVEVTLLFMP